MHREHTQVLVVGAGPSGMLAALFLKQLGVRVRIIDHEQRTTTRSHACVLHPGSLRLLTESDLVYKVTPAGRRIRSIGFYDATKPRAHLSTEKLKGDFQCMVVIPQNQFEEAIEKELSAKGVKVEWNHHLSGLSAGAKNVTTRIDRLAESGKGYAVPQFDWEISKSFDLTADFVIGADGHNSHVRQCLDIRTIPAGSQRTFAMYEFETNAALRDEMSVVFHNGTNVLWPLPENRCRWTFELTEEHLDISPEKERSPFVIQQPAEDRITLDTLQKLLAERAPWFFGTVGELEWSPWVAFEPSVIDRFGHGRCWLIGDAAHQTSPIGVQSMNIGLREASDLAGRIAKILQGESSLDLLESFEEERKSEWHQLLHCEGIKARPDADDWTRKHLAEFVSCLPASDEDLVQLLDELHIEFPLAHHLHVS